MKRRTWLMISGCVAAAGIDLAGNVAPVPNSWQSYLWVAWPVLGLLLVVTLAMDFVHRRAGGPTESSAESGEQASVRQNITSHGGVAQGAMYGNVINHGRPAAVPDPAVEPADKDDHV